MPYSGPDDPDLPENVKELSERRRRQWVEIWNSAFDRCMAGKTRVEDPDTEKCEAFAFANANGVVFAGMRFQNMTVQQVPRMEHHVGRNWLVFPAIPIVEGVMNGALVPADEIGRYVETWNGIPVTVNHPRKNGQYVSARSPDMEGKFQIGRFYKAKMDGTKLLGEVWIDLERVKYLGGTAVELVDRLQKGTPTDVSAAYFSDVEPEKGQKADKEYEVICRNIRPDHVALLLDEEGACSWDDGCGIPRTQQASCKEVPMENAVALNVLKRIAHKLLGKEVAVTKEELVKKLTANKACKFSAEELDKWTECALHTLAESLEAAVPEEEPAEEKAEREKAEAEASAAAGAEVPAWAKEIVGLPGLVAGLVTKVEALGQAVTEIRAQSQKVEEDERAEIVSALKTNKALSFTDEEMKTMPLAVLRKLASALAPAYYVGRAFPRPTVDIERVEPPPPLTFDKAALGWKTHDGGGQQA